MRIVPFEPWHLEALVLQPAQAFVGAMLEPDYAVALAAAGEAYSGLEDGRVVGCCGLVPVHPGLANAWALLGACGPGRFLTIHRAVLRFLECQPVRRIQTTVQSDFAAGHRWARALGFGAEARLEAWGPEGEDHHLYKRIMPCPIQ
jgi:hypothetical protein